MKVMKKKALSLALAAMFVFAGVLSVIPAMTAHAAGDKTLVIKKVLTMAESGVATPAETFGFTVVKHSFDRDEAKKNECPDLNAASASYTAADTADADTVAPGKQVVKLTGDMLDGVVFTKAGQYSYKITETAGSADGVTYSDAEYIVSLFVTKQADDSFKVDRIEIMQTKNDAGENIDSPAKTEYNPGDTTGNGNNFKFENHYDKKGGNPNPSGSDPTADDKKGLVISKAVEAGGDTNLEFGFKLTLTKPAGTLDTTTPTAKIVSAAGTAGAEQNLTYGTAFEFKLKAGERLVLNNVLLGSNAKIEEAEKQGYTLKTVTATGVATITSETDLKTTGIVLSDTVADANSALFTNEKPTATGVLLNNLPFILLFAVAGTGIALYVRNRRKAQKA